jgi:hypothetical protein
MGSALPTLPGLASHSSVPNPLRDRASAITVVVAFSAPRSWGCKMETTPGTQPEGRDRDRVAPIAGIVFAVLFVAGWLVGLDTPDYNAGDQAWTEWFEDAGNRGQHIFSAFALTVGALAFVVFLWGLIRRLRRFSTEPDGPTLLVLGAGFLVAAMTILAGVTIAAASAAIEFAPNDFPVPSADVLRMIEQLGVGIGLVGGGLSAALFVASSSWGARGTGALPGWLVVAGYVVAVLLLGSVTFIALVLLPLWVLVVSIVMLSSRSRSQGRAAPA